MLVINRSATILPVDLLDGSFHDEDVKLSTHMDSVTHIRIRLTIPFPLVTPRYSIH